MKNGYFEPLRNMQAFTEDMFNRIISFQEKEHPAWNTSLPFEQRIKDLPLHNLIFSNPDRDPLTTDPTVAHYYPLREEIQKIAHYVRQVKANELCDLYSGNGFIGSLIGREGIKVIGLHEQPCKPNQIAAFYDSNHFKFSQDRFKDLSCDAVLASWVPSNTNPTPLIVAHKPKLFIYIYTDHKNAETGIRQTGTDDMFEGIPDDYVLIDQWSVTRPENLLHDIWPDMTTNIEETRFVRVYAHTKIAHIDKIERVPEKPCYDWEKDLQITMLALEAKQQIEDRGYIV